jgi:hypothetical protein
MWSINSGSLFAWWVSSGSHLVETVLSLLQTMNSIHVQNSKTRSYYGYVIEDMLIATDPLKNLLCSDTFEQSPEHVQQIYKLYFFPIKESHKRITNAFHDYREKLILGDFYDGPLKFTEAKLHEFQIFLDCTTEIVNCSTRFIRDYAKLKPEVFRLCDMSLLND